MSGRRWIRYQHGWAVERRQDASGRWRLVLAWRTERHGMWGPHA